MQLKIVQQPKTVKDYHFVLTTRTDTRTHARTYAHAHAHAHARTRTRTRTHMSDIYNIKFTAYTRLK